MYKLDLGWSELRIIFSFDGFVVDHTLLPYFFYSLGILFREGLEALLVVVALASGTREAGQGDKTRNIYAGALVAILASIGLAWGVNHLISDDASDRLEGTFQLLAAGTLFYVSSWLTAKTQNDRWISFIRAKLKGARESSLPGLALAATAFLAVMREGAETIVFFQALTAGTTEAAEQHAVAAGIVVAAIGLVATFIVLSRAATKIPFGKFFFVTSVLLYGLAVVFVGQGVASFQEAGLIGATFIPHVPTVPVLGLFPTVQSIGGQLALLVIAVGALVPSGQERREKAVAREAIPSRPEVRPT